MDYLGIMVIRQQSKTGLPNYNSSHCVMVCDALLRFSNLTKVHQRNIQQLTSHQVNIVLIAPTITQLHLMPQPRAASKRETSLDSINMVLHIPVVCLLPARTSLILDHGPCPIMGAHTVPQWTRSRQ